MKIENTFNFGNFFFLIFLFFDMFDCSRNDSVKPTSVKLDVKGSKLSITSLSQMCLVNFEKMTKSFSTRKIYENKGSSQPATLADFSFALVIKLAFCNDFKN